MHAALENWHLGLDAERRRQQRKRARGWGRIYEREKEKGKANGAVVGHAAYTNTGGKSFVVICGVRHRESRDMQTATTTAAPICIFRGGGGTCVYACSCVLSRPISFSTFRRRSFRAGVTYIIIDKNTA